MGERVRHVDPALERWAARHGDDARCGLGGPVLEGMLCFATYHFDDRDRVRSISFLVIDLARFRARATAAWGEPTRVDDELIWIDEDAGRRVRLRFIRAESNGAQLEIERITSFDATLDAAEALMGKTRSWVRRTHGARALTEKAITLPPLPHARSFSIILLTFTGNRVTEVSLELDDRGDPDRRRAHLALMDQRFDEATVDPDASGIRTIRTHRGGRVQTSTQRRAIAVVFRTP